VLHRNRETEMESLDSCNSESRKTKNRH